MAAQYGEESIILDFFQKAGISNGFLVDAGAANGEDNSNTYFLLKGHGWQGILVEPNPRDFKNLSALYEGNERVKLLNLAVFSEEGTLPFYVEPGQASTLSTVFKSRVETIHHATYDAPILVPCIKLSKLLDENQSPKVIDFISIDCEGVDMNVLESMDWDKYKIRLLCVEHSMEKSVLHKFLIDRGYNFLIETSGNSFFTCGNINV